MSMRDLDFLKRIESSIGYLETLCTRIDVDLAYRPKQCEIAMYLVKMRKKRRN